jgi:hypothetical protein
MTTSYVEFLDNIETILAKNGFPQKRVALPRERMQQAALDKGLHFTKALEMLHGIGIGHSIEASRVVFFSVHGANPTATTSLEEKAKAFAEIFKGIDPAEFAALQGMNKFKMFFKLRELAKKFTPEQITKAAAQ